MRARWRIRLGLAAAMCFYILAVREAYPAGEGERIMEIILNPPALGFDEVQEILAAEAETEEALPAAFYQERQHTSAVSDLTGRTAYVTEMAFAGQAELLGNRCTLLNWNPGGCLVDEATAEALYGSGTQGEQSICALGQSYVVSGTVRSAVPLLLRRVRSGESAAMDHLLLYVSVRGNREEEARKFLNRHGLGGRVLDGMPLAVLCRNGLLLMPLILVLLLLGQVIRREAKGVHMAVMAAGLVLLLFAAKEFAEIPPDLIPTRWSDFGFWRREGLAFRENLLLLLYERLSFGQAEGLLHAGRSVLCSFLSVCFVLVAGGGFA